MHYIDWILLVIPLGIVFFTGIYMQRYMKSVADFISGGRLAGRYLLAVSKGEMQAGAVVFVASFEMISQSGFTLNWWGTFSAPIGLLIAIFGFVIYRYRETRVMTLAQFFEVRYSKSFRLFTGALGFIAGVLNFGIIPAVGARFLVYFMGLPASTVLFGYAVPTYVLLMGVFLTCTVILTLSGGLLALMMTDCIEGILSQIFYLIIVFSLLAMFKWTEISQVLLDRPEGHSLVNPFDIGKAADFDIWYTIMGIFFGIYGTMAWQNQSAYNSAAISAHESRMSGLLGRWREMGKVAVVVLLAVCAMTYLSHPDFTSQSQHAKQLIGEIHEKQIQTQMRLPIAVSEMLPVGVKGLLCAILIMGVFGGDSTHLHSWGGILVQDVYMPLRRKPFGPEQHIRALRFGIIFVAVFAFAFGSLFRQTEYVSIWFQVTTGIFVSGAGAVIIGGLYWKKGTTEAAWAAMITGSLLSGGGILARQFYGQAFPLNGTRIYFFSSLIAVTIYIVVSLLTCRKDFDMDRMLHRGRYADPNETPKLEGKKGFSWGKLIGFDENFSRSDKWIAGGLFGWAMFWFTVVVVGTIWNFIVPWPKSIWLTYWHVLGVSFPILFTVITAFWFTWGGLHDMKNLFRNLKKEKVNHLDDGTVINHHNLGEPEEPNTVSSMESNTKKT